MFSFASLEKVLIADLQSIVILIALFFGAAGVLLIIAIIISRIIRTQHEAKVTFYNARFQGLLNAIVTDGPTQQIPSASFDFKLNEIKRIISGSRMARQILISQIVYLKRNLTGSSAEVLRKIFYELDLHETSIQKLSAFERYEIKVKAMRELAEMNIEEAVPHLTPYFFSSNKLLAQESLLALTQIQVNEPLSYLGKTKQPINPWIKLNFFHYLSAGRRKTPDFTSLLASSNHTIVQLGVEMINQFRLVNAADKICALLAHENETIVASCARTLGNLGAYTYAPDLEAVLRGSPISPKVIRAALRSLGEIGDRSQHQDILIKYTRHEDFAVRVEAFRALIKLGISLEKAMTQDDFTRNEAIIIHLQEPLLQL